MKNYNYQDKLILVTGGSGFLGVPLVENLLSKGARVRILARDEGKLIDVKSQFPNVEILTGDILFDPEKDNEHSRDFHHVYWFYEICGNIPKWMIEKSDKKKSNQKKSALRSEACPAARARVISEESEEKREEW